MSTDSGVEKPNSAGLWEREGKFCLQTSQWLFHIDDVNGSISVVIDIPTGNWRKLTADVLDGFAMYKKLYEHAIGCVDRVFQDYSGHMPILPDFLSPGDDKFLGVMKLAEAYRKLTAEPAAAAKREALSRIQNAWQKIAGFATCDSSPGGDYRVTIKYPTLAKAQDAYSAIHNISKVLTEQLDPSTYSNATAVDLESGTFDFEPSPSEAERERIRYEYDDDRKSITKRYPSGQTENIGKGEAAAELDELQGLSLTSSPGGEARA